MIRLERTSTAHLPALVALEQLTFRTKFEALYKPEDFEAYMSEYKTPAAIAKKLDRPGTENWVAVEDDMLVGFLTLNLHKQPDQGGPLPAPMELEQIYVHPDILGKGIGKILMQRAYDTAREAQAGSIWLGVWEHNEMAQQFYRREGFEKFSSHVFYVGQQGDSDVLMKKVL